MLRFTAVGHVTNDRLPDGSHVAGGSALYAALAAAKLGARVRLVTSFGDDFVGRDLLRGIEVDLIPAEKTTCFENVYERGVRRQRVHAIAAPVRGGRVGDGDVVFYCPVIDEIAEVGGHRVTAVGIQGWLRDVSADGAVVRRPLARARVPEVDVLFCSVDDLASPDEIAALPGRTVVVTEGERGGRVGARRFRAYPHAVEVDPTGAGDVFATAFLIADQERHPHPAVFAACAASIVVEGRGAEKLGTRAEVDARVERYLRDITDPYSQG